jgi:hypothetical protein
MAGVLLGLSFFANMPHPIMCRGTTDQVKEVSGHARSTTTGGACSKAEAVPESHANEPQSKTRFTVKRRDFPVDLPKFDVVTV